jgi:hypothetical protein
VADAFSGRTAAAGRELTVAEETIVALGQELTAASRELTNTIDQAAPPPVVPAVPAR